MSEDRVLPIPGEGFRTTYRVYIIDEDGNRCGFVVERLVGKLLEDRRVKINQLERENAELRKQLEHAVLCAEKGFTVTVDLVARWKKILEATSPPNSRGRVASRLKWI